VHVTSRPRFLAPAAALAFARDLLLAHGLGEVARSSRGGSVYLRVPGGAHEVRLSTHRRTVKRRRQYPGVVTSIVIASPQSERQVRARVDGALRDAAAALAAG
jgi:hypothetical protein